MKRDFAQFFELGLPKLFSAIPSWASRRSPMHSLRQCIRRPLRLPSHRNVAPSLIHTRYASAKKNGKKNEELSRFQQLEKDHERMLSLIGLRVNAVSAEFAEVRAVLRHV